MASRGHHVEGTLGVQLLTDHWCPSVSAGDPIPYVVSKKERDVMGLDFVAVDFETANANRASMCAVGAVRVRNGVVVDGFSSLIRPSEGEHFASGNVRVHGITAEDVESAPSWDEVNERFISFVGDDLVVGHNVQFDMSVLMNTCGDYDIEFPVLNALCTLRLARSLLQLPSYSLPWVADHLGIGSFEHHDALSDARSAALILIALAAQIGADTVEAVAEKAQVRPAPTWVDLPDVAADVAAIGSSFAGHIFCFTGALTAMTRPRAREMVVELGGTWQDGVTKTTTILVTGDLHPSTFRPGAIYSAKLQKAFDRVATGQSLEIITEYEFLSRTALNAEELATKLAALGRKTKAPEWVIAQAGSGPVGDVYAWFVAALRHPAGRAVGEEPCTWCARPVPAAAHWIHRDRHVCGTYCNQRFKAGARRAWARADIAVPSMT